MQTLTLTEARRNLTRLVRPAIQGNDIGLVCDGRVVALRSVELHGSDDCLQEHGVGQDQVDRVIKAMDDETNTARKRGTLRVFNGKLQDSRQPSASRVSSGGQSLGSLQKLRVQAALLAVQRGFGQPHGHQGVGIRKLRPGLFECRAGLNLRLVLRAVPGELRFAFVGNHDEAARWLNSR